MYDACYYLKDFVQIYTIPTTSLTKCGGTLPRRYLSIDNLFYELGSHTCTVIFILLDLTIASIM